ncbi:transcriptional regulator with XRE-family HTH domain [Rhodococcus sp. 27YEA15]
MTGAISGDYRRAELARFLRSCRERTSPVDSGLLETMPPRRRIRGLRRPEVAQLAGVGLSWYTQLEQGREISLTIDVARSLVGAFSLSSDEEEYLYLLGGLTAPVDKTDQKLRGHRKKQLAEPQKLAQPVLVPETDLTEIQLVIDSFNAGDPIYAISRHWEVLAANSSAEQLLGVRVGTNCLVRMFTEPGRESWYGDPTTAGRLLVARYRQQVARYPYDRSLQDTVTMLKRVPSFLALWERHEVLSLLPETLSYCAGGIAAPVEYRTMGMVLAAYPSVNLALGVPVTR